MWTVVYIAQSTEEYKKVYNALIEEGILVRVKKIGKLTSIYEILVPQTEVDDASNVLTSTIF